MIRSMQSGRSDQIKGLARVVQLIILTRREIGLAAVALRGMKHENDELRDKLEVYEEVLEDQGNGTE